VYAQSTKKLNLYTQALLLLRRPPFWNSTARLARRARLDSLDKVERVESCRDEPSGIWALARWTVVLYSYTA